MSQNEETTLLFEDYLEGTLSEADKLALEERLKTDTQLAKDFKIYKEISEQLSHEFSGERKSFIENLDRISNSHFNENKEKKETTAKVIKFKPWQYGIAASIALLIGFFIFQNSGSASISDYTFSETIALTARSSDTTTSKTAENQFNKGSYQEAIKSFESLLIENPNNTEIQFYKALAHDAILQFDEADALFGKIYNGNSVYKFKAQYYRAISKWRSENIEEAKKLLASIPETAPEYKTAQRLLKKL